jgi:p-aminobenzoyl-glutamate transporter AbgT
VCLLLFLAFDAILIHEIIISILKTLSKQEVTEHALTYFLIFVGCALLSIMLIFVREKVEPEARTIQESDIATGQKQPARKLIKAEDATYPTVSLAPSRESNTENQEATKAKGFFKRYRIKPKNPS